MTKNSERIDYPIAIKWQLQQDRTRTLEGTIHSETMPCPIGTINIKTQEGKNEKGTQSHEKIDLYRQATSLQRRLP